MCSANVNYFFILLAVKLLTW